MASDHAACRTALRLKFKMKESELPPAAHTCWDLAAVSELVAGGPCKGQGLRTRFRFNGEAWCPALRVCVVVVVVGGGSVPVVCCVSAVPNPLGRVCERAFVHLLFSFPC